MECLVEEFKKRTKEALGKKEFKGEREMKRAKETHNNNCIRN